MIILDTNVVSELMKPRPNAGVLRWLAGQSRDSLCTTSITKGEILYGVVRLPDGRRKADLAAAAQRMFREDLPEPALAFDDAAAPYYAEILGARRRAGRPMTTLELGPFKLNRSHYSSWPGLTRPSTWIPGPSPGMTVGGDRT